MKESNPLIKSGAAPVINTMSICKNIDITPAYVTLRSAGSSIIA